MTTLDDLIVAARRLSEEELLRVLLSARDAASPTSRSFPSRYEQDVEQLELVAPQNEHSPQARGTT